MKVTSVSARPAWARALALASSAVMEASAGAEALWVRGMLSDWMTTPESASTWLSYRLSPEVKDTR